MELHHFLFNEEEYEPSSTVRDYSEKILKITN
ncbi:MAG: hypothetical protein K0S18_2131 [Anaerocolumna sp.]|nr:hypothetical protein [Anaerocolumna sp.]